jgi:hypothetical protein
LEDSKKGRVFHGISQTTNALPLGIHIQQLRTNQQCKATTMSLQWPIDEVVTNLGTCATLCSNNGLCTYFSYN